MKLETRLLLLAAALAASTSLASAQDLVVTPARGGGLDTTAPMIHADIFYDYDANEMHAVLDTSKATPHLLPLPAGYAFDSRSNYYVLSGKAYNYQYAWNPGGLFTNPPGAGLWIECLSASPGLECYDGPGNKNLPVPRTYAPIFGTAGSSPRWQWYGKMAHNSYAVLNPTSTVMTATYRVYFGDAVTGAPEAYAGYDDAIVTWTWHIDLPVQPALLFGAADDTGSAPLAFLNAADYVTNSGAVVNLRYTNAGPCASYYACCPSMTAVPATAANGGPATNHAALGSCLELQLVSLAGPPDGSLGFWEAGSMQPLFSIREGEFAGTNCFRLSQNDGQPGTDPYGCIQGRHFAVNRPGLYCLGFRILDSSTNGPAGGPLHAASSLYPVYLQAGATINQLTAAGATAKVYFGGEPTRTYYLERCLSLGTGPVWQTVAGPLTGTSRIQSLTDPAAPAGSSLFRLRITTP